MDQKERETPKPNIHRVSQKKTYDVTVGNVNINGSEPHIYVKVIRRLFLIKLQAFTAHKK